MNKFFRKVLVLGGVALAAHFGLKAYKRINGLAKLDKSLPEFLNNVYGAKPKISINQTMNMLTIKLGFPQEILDKHTDIETTVREYIDDFYPEMGKGAININIHAQTADEGEDLAEEEAEQEL
ncbi:MAG: hypothetical protein KBA54_04225 [Candidatus Cloacimonetes bacterium]|nr:hypothetical protein [Candidatus Cloacimonadota bacterium]